MASVRRRQACGRSCDFPHENIIQSLSWTESDTKKKAPRLSPRLVPFPGTLRPRIPSVLGGRHLFDSDSHQNADSQDSNGVSVAQQRVSGSSQASSEVFISRAHHLSSQLCPNYLPWSPTGQEEVIEDRVRNLLPTTPGGCHTTYQLCDHRQIGPLSVPVASCRKR